MTSILYRSQAIDIPTNVNLTELLHSTADSKLPESHIICSDNLTNRSITIGELRVRAGRIARGLQEQFQQQDNTRWALVLPNSVEFLELVHSILWTGGVFCPINHALKATEIGHGLAISRPSFVVAYGRIVTAVEEAVEIAMKDLTRLGIFWKRPTIVTAIERHTGYKHIPDDFYASIPLDIPHFQDTSERLASIHLSSGTTGKPKGVELSHFNFVANCYQLRYQDPVVYSSKSKTVAFTPWVHIGATTVPLFLGPWVGMFHHAMPTFSMDSFACLVGSVQATMFSGVPSVVLGLANGDFTSKYDFSRAQVINVGGAPFKAALLEKLYQQAPWRLNQVYGMTEAAGYVAYQRLGETIPDEFIGSFLPNIEARLVKEGTRNDAPRGGPGELWLRGPNITKGYAFDDDANQKGFPETGWYNTGDVCIIDHSGRVGVVGRTKDLIKYKGFQISPVELEGYLNSHPLVAEAGVGSLWDESQLTELPTAWVVLKSTTSDAQSARMQLQDIHRSVDAQVSGYKKLRGGVWSVPALPKNATGKIIRKEMGTMKNGVCSLDAAVLARL